MELIIKSIYQILHVIGCPEKDMKRLNNSTDICSKCGRVRYNFRRY